MAFNQFNRAGHRMLSAEISEELKALAARHGLTISVGGGVIGDTELTIKVIVKTNDLAAIAAKGRRELGLYGRWAGLKEEHYDAIFTDRNGERWQLKGYSPNRPKYPIDMVNLRTGKTHKGTESYGKQFIAAYQAKVHAAEAAAIAANQTSKPASQQTPPPATATPGLEAFSQF
jgi:hypothetical protein